MPTELSLSPTLASSHSGGQDRNDLYKNDMKKLLTMKKKITAILVASCVVFFLGSVSVQAAEFFLDAESLEVGVGETFEITAYLNTQDDDINAVEGAVTFPEDLLDVVEVREGSSIVSFWIEDPSVVSKGVVAFSGITPGGFAGARGKIVSVVFETKKEGVGTIGFENMIALINDGKATLASTTVSPLRLSVTSTADPKDLEIFAVEEDKAPPEIFIPTISLFPDIKKDKYFLVFSTQDKLSGIDYYEITEGNRRSKIAESPYLLRRQNLDVDISIKAVDKSGNERIAIVPASNPQVVWYQDTSNLGIIIVIVTMLYLLWRLRKKKRL